MWTAKLVIGGQKAPCPNCGHEPRERTRFCARCGQQFPQEADSTSGVSGSPPAAAPPPVQPAEPAAGPPYAPPPAPQPWGVPAPAPPAPTGAGAPPGPYAPPSQYGPPPGSGQGPYTPPGAMAPPPNPYAPPPPPTGYGYGYAPGYGVARTNGLAVASLVLGIVGWALCGIGSILAIVFGVIARNQIRASGGREGGDGMAKAGVILGCVFLVLLVAYVIVVAIVAASDGSAGTLGV